MADLQDPDPVRDEDYDEEADSDFQADALGDEEISSASDDEPENEQDTDQRPRKRRKIDNAQHNDIPELDSGDEATIREQKKSLKKQRKSGEEKLDDDDNESDGWRARTRAMRTKEKEERKRNKLASVKGSTIDVDKLWEEMNRPRPLPAPSVVGDNVGEADTSKGSGLPPTAKSVETGADKENLPADGTEETITIKRTYKFAGEVHVEEKTVLKSSAEAQLWLAQQQSSKAPISASDGKETNRPLRKISRFDPNFSNLEAFKALWADKNMQATTFKGPKLNVVEKSKMDWAAHVDVEGLKEELDTHAKARDGYLSRMDFLKGVEERKEAEARAARLKGH